MREWEFTLVLHGDLGSEVVIDKLYELGGSDATFGVSNGVPYADFVREAPSFPDAVVTAIRQVEAVPGLIVLRVEPDELVTISEIAERLGETRESIRLKAMGKRGRGDFPAPVLPFRTRSRLWRWSEVAVWAGLWGEEEKRRAAFIEVMNAALKLRRRTEFPTAERHLLEMIAG